MKNFKSKLPDAKEFQQVTGVNLEDELRELLGSTFFEIKPEADFLSLVEMKGDLYAIYANDFIILTENNELLVLEKEELNESYVKVP